MSQSASSLAAEMLYRVEFEAMVESWFYTPPPAVTLLGSDPIPFGATITQSARPGFFICEHCGKEEELSDHGESLQEMRENFGNIAPSERAVVCDACYTEFMKWHGEKFNGKS